MIRAALMSFALSLTILPACVDEEDPGGPEKSGEEDPDFEQPGDREDDPPTGCRVNIQDSEDPDCTPKT